MQATPLRKYRIPAYPTRLEVLEQPELLERHLPPGWRATAEMAGLAGVFLALNSTLRAEETTQPAKPEAAVVAPIFEHGEGRGLTGCEGLAPPVFLSEEEAMQVIAEELSQAGIDVGKRNATVPGVIITPRVERPVQKDGKWEVQVREVPDKAKALEVDVLDEKHKVAVEYLSQADYFSLGGVQSASSVQDYGFKEAAGRLGQEVGKQGKGVYFGVFFDPLLEVDMNSLRSGDAKEFQEKMKELERKAGVESKRLLRLQVKDFIDWLKGQGVI